MPQACPSCGTENAQGAKFCNECGGKLGTVLTQPPLSKGADYVTRRVARTDLSRGERRVITVLFADIKDYTALSERLDPEQVEDLVGGLFREFSEVITAHGGYVDKFMGDAILALFGAPRSLGDDAERAVTAALEMQRRAKQANLGRDVRLDVRVGLDTGEVVVGNLGQRGEYTAIGDPVNTANRVQGAAEIGAVYLSDAAAQQVKGRFRMAELPPTVLKGKAEPVVLWRVDGAAKQTEHYLGSFVGRRREIELLMASFESSVRERASRFVLVRGDAGMGKSRLFYEFRRRLRAAKHAPTRITAAFQPVGMEPMQGMRQIARALLGLDRSSPQQATETAIDGLATANAPESLHDHLRYVLGRNLADLASSGLQTRQRQEGAWLALRHLLEQRAQAGPLLLVFEDLHWADADSMAFLRNLARAALRVPLFVLALGRPEAIDMVRDLLGDPFENIELRPMEAPDVAALSAGVLHDAPVDDALAALVAERSGGNPFVTEELIKGLHESGVLRPQDGRYTLAPGHNPSQIPVGVRSILAARIDALAARDRAVISALSVLGREFRRNAAERLCGESTGPALELLVERGMLNDLGDDRGQRRFMFCHALLQEVAYSGLLKRDKVQLHRVAADFYRQQMADNPQDPRRLSRLAWHLACAGDSAEAAARYLESGRIAAREWMCAFAAEQFRAALVEFDRAGTVAVNGESGPAARVAIATELVDSLKESGRLAEALEVTRAVLKAADAPPNALASLLERAANAAWRKSEFEQSLDWASQAQQLCARWGNADGAARCALQETAALLSLGRVDQARARFAALTDQPDAPWRMEYLRTASILCQEQGRTADALPFERQRADLARRAGNRRTLASALGNIAMYQSDLGNYTEAGQLFQEALGEYRAAGDLFNVSAVLTNLGNFKRRTSDIAGALASHQEARTLAAQLGDDYGVLVGDLNVATCQMSLGQYTQALRSYEHAEPALRRFRPPQLESQALLNRAVASARTGDFRLARASLDKARDINSERRNRRGLLQGELLLADDLLRVGEFDRARETLRQLALSAAESGFRRYAASAGDHLVDIALVLGDLPGLESALDGATEAATEEPGTEALLSQKLHRAIAVLWREPAAGLQPLAVLLPVVCQTAADALLLSSAAIAAAYARDRIASLDLESAIEWADRAVRAMEAGGRADARLAMTLASRGLLRATAGRDATADLARARAAADRLEAAWIVRWIDQRS